MKTPNIRALALAKLLRCSNTPVNEHPEHICLSCQYRELEKCADHPGFPVEPDGYVDGEAVWVSCDIDRLTEDAAAMLEYLGGGGE